MQKNYLFIFIIVLFSSSCQENVRNKVEFKTAKKFAEAFSENSKDEMLQLLDDDFKKLTSDSLFDSCMQIANSQGYLSKSYEESSYSSGKYPAKNSRYYAFMFCWQGEPHKGAKHRIEVVVLDSSPDKVMAFRVLFEKQTLFQLPVTGLSGLSRFDKMVRL